MAGRVQVTHDLVEVVVQASSPQAAVSQELVEVVVAAPTASPTVVTGAGVTQELVEVVVRADAPSIFATQELVEVVVLADALPAVVSQELVEVVVLAGSPKAAASQALVEVVVAAPTASPTVVTGAGVTQELVEVVVLASAPAVFATQELVEVVVLGIAPVNADLTINPSVRALRDGDLGFSYTIGALAQVEASLSIDYALNASQVGANLGFSYKVAKATKLQQRGQDLRLRYEVIVFAQVGANLGIDYGVAPAATIAGLDLNLDAPVQNVVHPGVDLVFTYDVQVPEPVASDLGLDYSIAAGSAQVVYVFTPQAAGPARRVEPPARIARPVSADLTLDAPVRRATGGDLTFTAPIRRAAGSALAITSPIRRSVATNATIDWAIRRTTGVSLDVDAAIHRTVGADVGFSWLIRQRVAVTSYLNWEIRQLPPEPTYTPQPAPPPRMLRSRWRPSLREAAIEVDAPEQLVTADPTSFSKLGLYSGEEVMALARRFRIGFRAPSSGTLATPSPREPTARTARRRAR